MMGQFFWWRSQCATSRARFCLPCFSCFYCFWCFVFRFYYVFNNIKTLYKSICRIKLPHLGDTSDSCGIAAAFLFTDSEKSHWCILAAPPLTAQKQVGAPTWLIPPRPGQCLVCFSLSDCVRHDKTNCASVHCESEYVPSGALPAGSAVAYKVHPAFA